MMALDMRLDPTVAAADRIRGHAFQPPKADLAKIPALYATEATEPADKTLWLHFFVGGCDWYVAELDQDIMLAFGWARLSPGCGEWGYMDLLELATTLVPMSSPARTVKIAIERDKWWTPTKASDILRKEQ
jgi:hypothetical protein